MYKKILVPLDQSPESQGVLPFVKDLIGPAGEGILLHIIPPGKTRSMGGFVQLKTQVEEQERAKALFHLKGIAGQIGADSGRWRCEVAISGSAADGIVDVANREEVDLIAMYTHGRKGLAKVVKGSIAEKVQKKANTEVQVFRERELVAS